MLSKTFVLSEPVDKQVVPLEQFLTAISKNFTNSFYSEYTGSGLAKTITVPFTPSLILLMKKADRARDVFPLAGDIAISLFSNKGVTWLSSGNFVVDAVTDIQPRSFTLGLNAAVNTAGALYVYFVLG